MAPRPSSHRVGRRAAQPRAARALLILVAAVTFAGCSGLAGTAPAPTPLDFPGIAGELAKVGILIGDYKSGDAGCADGSLIPTAVGFDAAGLDQKDRVHLRVYIFRNRETFDRRRPDVDTCAAAWATDPATFEFIDASPYVLAGQGPWGDGFHAALRVALVAAAGNGG
jgi:hypothetical protein